MRVDGGHDRTDQTDTPVFVYPVFFDVSKLFVLKGNIRQCSRRLYDIARPDHWTTGEIVCCGSGVSLIIIKKDTGCFKKSVGRFCQAQFQSSTS